MNERLKHKNYISWYITDDKNYMIINCDDDNNSESGYIKYYIKWNGELNWELVESTIN